MSDFPRQGIFLSYRREDAAPYARLIQIACRERFPAARVFRDLDSIEAGQDFVKVIGDAVGASTVLVALIGSQWATLADERGRRRLDDSDDFVRFEIRTAFERDVRVIPVLVGGARPFRLQELPAELQQLARLHAFELSHNRYQQDADKILDLIQQVLDNAATRRAAEKAGLPNLELLARTAEEAGEANIARSAYDRLAAEREKALGPEHPDTLAARSNLARWTGKAGDADKAQAQLDALLPAYERVLGPEHPDTLTVRRDRAAWTAKAGHLYVARDQYFELYTLAARVLGKEHPLVVEVSDRWWLEEAIRDSYKRGNQDR